ncbi:MAG: DNA mismatch repair protein MutS [Bacillota bacterium]|nr:DNA mismatch repair protein MutS [Bacillota bacterium]
MSAASPDGLAARGQRGPGRSAGTPPLLDQYLRIKAEHPDALLFFRLGDFFELFFEDAEIAARELDLVLTGRELQKGHRVPMCGVPHHAAEGYIRRLVERGYRVALCEQMEDPRLAKGLVQRQVIQVISAGTLLEPGLLDAGRNNFLAVVAPGRRSLGLAYADASTGEFRAGEWEAGEEGWLEELDRLQPAEVLLPEGLPKPLEEAVRERGFRLTRRPAGDFDPSRAAGRLKEHFELASLDVFGLEPRPQATAAAGALLAYLEESQPGGVGQLTEIRLLEPGEAMLLDPATRRNLELTQRGPEGGRQGTLLEALDGTVSALGLRTLRRWIERPLNRAEPVLRRLDAVETLVREALERSRLRKLLGGARDVERLATRAVLGLAGPRELLEIAQTMEAAQAVRQLLSGLELPELLQELSADLEPPPGLAEEIRRALVDEPPAVLGEGDVIRPGYDQEVDRLRALSGDSEEAIRAIERRERERTGIRSLRVGYNRVFGYYLEVSRSQRGQVPPDYTRKQTLANAERYVTRELSELEARVESAREALSRREAELFADLRARVGRELRRLRASARALGRLDALQGLAQVAAERGWVRPEVDGGDRIEIVQGRHPVVERMLGPGEFVPNDTVLGPERRILLITGPNMAGKSTYARQVAVLVLAAQVGSFLPAESARIGVVDRIFTRIGSADDLAAGKSTFMVEMGEVAHILRRATPRSLVILDEVGRGTSTFDGLSLAWAVTEYLHDRVGARTLFATHYHELTGLEAKLPALVNLTMAVEEEGGRILFLRRVRPGAASRSYGIEVARLAGIPAEVLRRAQKILERLEREQARRAARSRVERSPEAEQMTLVPPPEMLQVLEELRQVDVERTTPLEALERLAAWQALLRGSDAG